MNIGKKIGLVLLIFETAIFICFACLASYEENNAIHTAETNKLYPMFQDVQIMILVGFGMLMTFFKKYGYSGVSLNLLVAAITFQCAIIFSRIENHIFIGTKSLTDADILTAAILISLGAVLGKVSPLQILLMILIETPLYIGNKYLSDQLQIVDVGGSIGVHTFGTYFGLAVSKILGKPKNTVHETTSYQSNIFSMIGTLFLWAFWPSFNGILSTYGQERAIVNTYLALLSSTVVCFALSSLTNSKHKFTMAHIQNATLAGGVAIGTAANLKIYPWGAILVGALGGAICVIGFVYIQPWLLKHFNLHDTCGINNLHGMTSILAGIVGAIAAGGATKEYYKEEFDMLFPARTSSGKGIFDYKNRSAGVQAAYQILVLVLTFIISISGGVITGLVLKLGSSFLGKIPDELNFDDNYLFDGVDDDEFSIKTRTPTVETVSESVRNV